MWLGFVWGVFSGLMCGNVVEAMMQVGMSELLGSSVGW